MKSNQSWLLAAAAHSVAAIAPWSCCSFGCSSCFSTEFHEKKILPRALSLPHSSRSLNPVLEKLKSTVPIWRESSSKTFFSSSPNRSSTKFLCSSSLSLNYRWFAGQYPGRALHAGQCPARALCTGPSLWHPTNQGWNWWLVHILAGRYVPVLAYYILQTKDGIEGQCPGRALHPSPSLLHPTNQGRSWGSGV